MNKENTKYGQRNSRLYKIWNGMKYRCYNTKSDEYEYYSGRGIVICDEWNKDFAKFYKWSINNGYRDNLTIDRINVNENYEPLNCRWETMKVQENNKRNNRNLLFKGKEQTVTQWSEEIGIKKETILSRLNAGWSIEKALSEPVKKRETILNKA